MNHKMINPFASKATTNMYLKSELADVHFTFSSMESKPAAKVPAHKVLLASSSPGKRKIRMTFFIMSILSVNFSVPF